MTRNSEVLKDFVDYCNRHPTERFWQALRNWSGYGFVYVSNTKPPGADTKDTFYTETKEV